jgi:hypothetical protein
MSNVVEHDFSEGVDDCGIQYVIDEDRNPVGVTHKDWSFSISRSDDGKEIALVSDDGEAFGVLGAEQFNHALLCWLLIDDPELVDSATEYEVGKDEH